MTEILRVEGLHKRFGGIVVSDNVNLSIASGEILGLIGPNGAGKTSLFNLISGVLRPDAGSIVLRGQKIDGQPLYKRARMGIARTWQNMLLFRSMTVLDNLLVGPRDYAGESIMRLAFGRAGVRTAEAAMHERAMGILGRMELGVDALAEVGLVGKDVAVVGGGHGVAAVDRLLDRPGPDVLATPLLGCPILHDLLALPLPHHPAIAIQIRSARCASRAEMPPRAAAALRHRPGKCRWPAWHFPRGT